MKKIFLLFFILSINACSRSGSESASGLLAPQAFAGKLKTNSDIVLLDVRSRSEMQTGYLPGAQNLDFNSPGFKNSLDSLDHSKTYYVYCASGKRSGKTLEMMKASGFQNVTALEGGLNAWTAAGLPVQRP